MMQYNGFFIDGALRPAASRARIAVTSSIDGTEIGRYPEATTNDIDAAVAASRAALAPGAAWTRLGPEGRAAAMESLALALKARVDPIGELIAHEVGSPLAFAKVANAVSALSQLRYYAKVAREFTWEAERPARLGRTIVRREPVGVVAAIVPWNIPISLTMFKLGPALAAGCTVVVKPSPETALSSYLLAEAIAESDIPDGVVNIVPAGREVSEYLVTHPRIDKVSFTGSTATGRRVAALAGAQLTPVTLELGGKSAAIVLPDADLDTFVAQLPALSFMNNGQTCTLDSRILVPRSRSREMLEALGARVDALRVGSPFDEDVEIGPMVSASHREKVEEYLRLGPVEGARVIAGGRLPAGLERGQFVPPTLFGDVNPGMRIAGEEIFGPVVSVLEYADTDEAAIALANDSEFGLAATVWSSDLEHAVAVSRRIEAGVVGANVWNLDHNAPFGGRKASGVGHELGPEALDAYLVYQSIYTPEAISS